jgi:hypothetical protein
MSLVSFFHSLVIGSAQKGFIVRELHSSRFRDLVSRRLSIFGQKAGFLFGLVFYLETGFIYPKQHLRRTVFSTKLASPVSSHRVIHEIHGG